jgi:ribosomal-protein-alanine N-acetyltransferase
MEFLQATAEQIDTVNGVVTQCREALTERGILQWDAQYPSRAFFEQAVERGRLFVLTEPGVIHGVVVLDEGQPPGWDTVAWQETTGPFLVIHSFAVPPCVQGRGYGTTLLDFCEAFASKSGYSSIRLDAFGGNASALRFYEKRGYLFRGVILYSFKPEGRQRFHCFEKSLLQMEPQPPARQGNYSVLTELPTLETKRLLLRPFAMSDAPAVQILAAARQVADTTLNIPHPYPEDGASTWIASHPANIENGQYTFAVVRKQDQVLVGAMGIATNSTHNKGELGYWVGLPYWNQGFATEAAQRIVHWGFEVLELNRIFARYLVRNPASARVMQKAGLKHEGIFRQDVLKWDVYEDIGLCGLIRAEYDGLRRGAV